MYWRSSCPPICGALLACLPAKHTWAGKGAAQWGDALRIAAPCQLRKQPNILLYIGACKKHARRKPPPAPVRSAAVLSFLCDLSVNTGKQRAPAWKVALAKKHRWGPCGSAARQCMNQACQWQCHLTVVWGKKRQGGQCSNRCCETEQVGSSWHGPSCGAHMVQSAAVPALSWQLQLSPEHRMV